MADSLGPPPDWEIAKRREPAKFACGAEPQRDPTPESVEQECAPVPMMDDDVQTR